MKVRIPAKTVCACDICKRETQPLCLDTCVICQREYCHVCQAIMCGCIHQPDLCRECADKDPVKKVVEKFAKPILEVLKRRDAELIKLRSNGNDTNNENKISQSERT